MLFIQSSHALTLVRFAQMAIQLVHVRSMFRTHRIVGVFQYATSRSCRKPWDWLAGVKSLAEIRLHARVQRLF